MPVQHSVFGCFSSKTMVNTSLIVFSNVNTYTARLIQGFILIGYHRAFLINDNFKCSQFVQIPRSNDNPDMDGFESGIDVSSDINCDGV